MTYVHRIGRTARAGASGKAITLVDWEDMPRWKLICDALGLPFHEPSETYSTSEHLYLELDIPRELAERREHLTRHVAHGAIGRQRDASLAPVDASPSPESEPAPLDASAEPPTVSPSRAFRSPLN